MSENSKIEWCDHTFNPWEGCQKVGPGCDHCYAEARNVRFAGGTAINWGPGAPRRRTSPANWRKPLAWNAAHDEFFAAHGRRQRVFCASLADVFDNEVSLEWFVELLDVIRLTPNLDWLLLTKRIGRVRSAIDIARRDVNVTQAGRELFDWLGNWEWGLAPHNVWLGATVVDQQEANRDIPKLLATPARVRFLSMEPLLGPVDLERPIPGPDLDQGGGAKICQPWMIQSGIDWVIAGGESGPHARPMHPQWARDIRDQCATARVPFLFKQWGEWKPICQMEEDETCALYRSNRTAKECEDQGVLDELHGRTCKVEQLCLRIDGKHAPIASPNAFLAGTSPMHAFKVGKRVAGRQLDGRTHDEFPEAS